MNKHTKIAAWREAAMAVEERAQLIRAAPGADEHTGAIAEHMLAVIAPSLRQRAEIIRRRKPKPLRPRGNR